MQKINIDYVYNTENKKEIYEYIDLNNYTYYLNKIENTALKTNKFSFEVLLEDFDKNIVYNNNILMFINDIEKIIKKMEKYFNLDLISNVEQLHQECLNKFYILINNEINNLIYNKNYKYYLFIKKQIYKKLNLIYNCYNRTKEKKINEKQKLILNRFIKDMVIDYNIRKNVLKKINNINKENISYDDLLYINLNNINEMITVIKQINENTKIYKKVSLPSEIIIKENNQNYVYYYKYLNINKKNINKYIKNKRIYSYIIIINIFYKFKKHVYYIFISFYNEIRNILLKHIITYYENISSINQKKEIDLYYIDKHKMEKLINFVKQGIGGFTLNDYIVFFIV